MKCSEINNKMIAYLENDLPGVEMIAFEDHLSECANCMRIFTEVKTTWKLIETEKNIRADDFYFTRLEQAIKNKGLYKNGPVSQLFVGFTSRVAAVLLILISMAAGILIGSGFTGDSSAATYQDEYEYFSEVMYLNSLESEPIENYLLNKEGE